MLATMSRSKESKALLFVVVAFVLIIVAYSIPNNPIKNMFNTFLSQGDKVLSSNTLNSMDNQDKTKQNSTDKAQESQYEARQDKDTIPEQNDSLEFRLNKALLVQDIEKGQGAIVKQGSSVSIKYIGMFTNGNVFDQSPEGQPLDVVVGETPLIKGFTEGLLGLQEGGVRKLTMNSSVAYGERGNPPTIPPNSDLIFHITAVSVR